MKVYVFLALIMPLLLWGSDLKSRRIAVFTPEQSKEIINKSRDQVVRRGAFRTMIDGKVKKNEIIPYLKDSDPIIRKAALNWLCMGDKDVLAYLKTGLDDSEPQIRIYALGRLGPYLTEPGVNELVDKIARNDQEKEVRELAGHISWPFKRENRLLRNDPSWDYAITTVKTFQLPDDNWKFITDLKGEGHRKNYFKDDFADDSWKPIKVGHWELQGWPDYDGIGWYRIRFKMPEKIDSNAVEITFGGVDESAWVWMNGIYLGKHDIGTDGWAYPFTLDMTKEIKWGEENILTVRVMNRSMNGGIYKPVMIEILK